MADLRKQTDVSEPTCTIPKCPNLAKAKGWCRKHLSRYYRHGDPLYGEDAVPVGTSGVYSITCTANGRVYIGSSMNIRQRWTTHKSWLRKGTHNIPLLQADWTEYGEVAFEFALLADIEERARRYQVEEQFIEAQMAKGDCYNTSACSRVAGGYTFTDEQRQHVSDALKGKPKSAEHRANLWQDRPVTDEFRETMAANGRKLKGVEKSDETRLRMSAAQENRVLLTEPQVREIKRLLAQDELTGGEIGRMFGVGRSAICAIKSGRTWPNVTLDDPVPSPAAIPSPSPVPPGEQLPMFA